MSVVLRTNQITGVSVVVNATDGASKEYADNASGGGTPSITGNENEFLTTDGSTTSWQPIQGYQEYTTAGNYTFNVPTHATELFIEATGAGGGGGSGLATTSTTYVNRGEFWFLRTSGTTSSFTGNGNVGNPLGSYGLGFYVMGTGAGTIHASTDSITWVARTSGFGTSAIFTVNYGSNIFISTCAITGTGPLRTSTDTIHWILRTSGSVSPIITTISTDNNFHLYADENGQIRSSTDGITWNIRTTPTAAAFSMYSRAYSASPSTNYVFAGSTGIVASTDGIIWRLRTSGRGTTTFYCGTYGNGIYLLGSSGGSIIASTDTIVWVARTQGGGSSNQMSDIIFNNNIYIASQLNFRNLMTSTDSIVWIVRTSPSANANYRVGIYANSIFVYGANNGTIIASPIPTGNAGSGGGGGATVGSIISKSNISSPTLTVNVGSGGTAGTAGAASTVSWTSPGGNFSITANGGSAGVSTILSSGNIIPGGSGGTVSSVSNNYLYAFLGTTGGDGGYFESSSINSQGLSSSDSFRTNRLTNSLLGAQNLTPSIVPTITLSGNDQGYWFLTLPWTIYYNESSYSTCFVGTDSWITFGSAAVSSPFTTITASYPPYDKILISGSDNSCQRIYYGIEGTFGNRTYRIRWEGTNATTGTLGAPNMVWEVIFYEATPGRIDVQCGENARGSLGLSGFYSSSALLGSFFGDTNTGTTFYAAVPQPTGGGGGTSSLFGGQFGSFGGTIPYYGNTYQNSKTISALMNGTSSLPIGGLSYGNGGNGGGAQHGAVAWVLRTSGFGATAYGIGGGNGVYVIVGASGNLRTSTDTITWTLRTSGFGTSSINEIISDGTNLVAVSNGGAIRASTNGIQWSIRTSPTTNNLGNPGNTGPAGIYANNLYLVGGTFGTYVVSTDSIVWTLRTNGIGANTVWSVAYGSALTEKYLISAGGILASSTDNISWTLRTSGTGALNSLNYFNSNYYSFNNSNVIRTSTNGIEWSNQVTVSHGLYSSAVSNNSLITGGATGSVYSSTNGISWVLRTSNVGSVNAFAFGYGNGLFLATYGSSAQVIVADSNINGGNGGAGTRGGGGGGGAYSLATNTAGTGGTGGDGYVRISWQ